MTSYAVLAAWGRLGRLKDAQLRGTTVTLKTTRTHLAGLWLHTRKPKLGSDCRIGGEFTKVATAKTSTTVKNCIGMVKSRDQLNTAARSARHPRSYSE